MCDTLKNTQVSEPPQEPELPELETEPSAEATELSTLEAPEDSAPQLSDEELGILALEKKRFRYPGAKEQAMRQQLSLTPIAYYQKLNRMIDDPRVIARDPALTRRLRLHRDTA